jgi:hypothetical protein
MNDAYLPHNKRAHTKRIYFYVLEPHQHDIAGHHGDTITEYLIKEDDFIDWDDIPRLIPDILDAIRGNDLKPTDSKQLHRKWKRRSYFVYYHPTEQLSKGDAVVFTGGEDNRQCFRDARDVPLDAGASAFYCINHMLDKDGGAFPSGAGDAFDIDIYHGHGAVRRRSHNDSGTNTGPP